MLNSTDRGILIFSCATKYKYSTKVRYLSSTISTGSVAHWIWSWTLKSWIVGSTPIRGDILSPAFAKARGHYISFVRPSVRPSVTKTLTLAKTFTLLQVELWYLACVFVETRHFRLYHVVTLMVTFDLLQCQICCRAGDHNSRNLLVCFVLDWSCLKLHLGGGGYLSLYIKQNKTFKFSPGLSIFLSVFLAFPLHPT